MAPVDPNDYVGFVHFLARRAHRRARDRVSFDDLVQAGYLGLVEAARGFDVARGTPFLAYARPRISGAIFDLLGAADPVSKRERRTRRELRDTDTRLTGQLGRPPTADQLAEALGTDAAAIAHLRVPGPREVSLDDDAEPVHVAADDPSPELATARDELGRGVAECLEALTPESRLVVVARVLDGLTLETLGTLLGSSKDRIWRLEHGARRALRACLERKGWDAADSIDAARG